MAEAEKKKLNNERCHDEKNRRSGFKIYVTLFWEFLKIGLFTIGGGLAMIPQLQHIVVNEKGWLEDDEMLDCIAISQALPGIVAINMATYVGAKLRGIKGAVAATVGVIMPSLVIIILAVTVLESINDNSYVQGAFTGIKAAVCGLILVTVVRTGKKILTSWLAWVLAVLAFIAVVGFGVNAAWTVLAGAVIGVIYTAAGVGRAENSGNEEAYEVCGRCDNSDYEANDETDMNFCSHTDSGDIDKNSVVSGTDKNSIDDEYESWDGSGHNGCEKTDDSEVER